MVRPIYPHELADPDFSWLLTTFKENHPHFISVEGAGLPLVLINFEKEAKASESEIKQIVPEPKEDRKDESLSNK